MKKYFTTICCLALLCLEAQSQKHIKCLTISNDTVQLTLSDPTIIVFLNQSKCGKCFEELSDLFHKIETTRKIKFILLARVGPSAKTRRSVIASLKNYFDFCDSCYYFDVDNYSVGIEDSSMTRGMFKELNIYNSPAIMLFDIENTRIWLNSDIFDDQYTFKQKFIESITLFFRE